MKKSDLFISVFSLALIIVFGVGSLLLSVFYIYIPLKGVCNPDTHMALLIGVMISAFIVGEFVVASILIHLANKYSSPQQRSEWRSQFNQGKENMPWLAKKTGDLMLSRINE